jgi:hypothetical protein
MERKMEMAVAARLDMHMEREKSREERREERRPPAYFFYFFKL